MELPRSGFLPTAFSALLRPFIRLLDKESLPKYQGQLSLAGLEKSVQVRWDPYAIPHVFAADESDLFLAQGYLHAQERLWQMEMSRRFFSGRMAEIFGDFALPWRDLSTQFRGLTCVDFDYFIRLLGIRAAGLAALEHISDQDRLRLRAYCNGINRHIERCGKKLPWEFRLLRHQPEVWRPEDTLSIGKGLSFLLSTAFFTRLNFLAVATHLKNEPDKLAALYPSYADGAPTITRSIWDQASNLWQFASGILAASDLHPAGTGSNNWAVAPSRSVTGNAMLCNDPHLRMTLPSTWYLMHLKADVTGFEHGDYEVWGASIPGLPFIQLGHNRRIAWGMTAAVCDDVELYREKLHALEPDRYLVGFQWQKLETRLEQIAIRGKRPIERIVRWTRHGPIISDFNRARDSHEVLSVRWTAHEPSQEIQSLYGVNCARNWDEFQQSLRHHGTPSLNFVYADADGNIGYSLAGKIPRRAQVPTLGPVEGWSEQNDWLGYIPFDELPRIYNPPEGFVATANNRIADSSYPFYLSHFFEPPHRFRRIHQLLGAREMFSADDMAAIQLDTVSLHAKELIETLSTDLARLGDDNSMVKDAAIRLFGWNGQCAESSVEATIFHVFHHRLLTNLLVPSLGEELFAAYVEILNQSIVPTDGILNDVNSPWFAVRSRYELVALSLREACVELKETLGENLAEWEWGKIHQLQMNHPFGRINFLKPLLAVGPIATAGDGMTINLGFYRHSNPYSQTVGASLRFIVELGNQESSGFILPSGQSGHPLSAHYGDQISLWLRGERILLHAGRGLVNPYNSGLLLTPD